MAKSFSGLGKFGRFIGGSRSDHTIVGCRQDPNDNTRFYVMEASGNERPDGMGKPIQTIINGGDRSTIVCEDGSKVQILHENGCKRGI